MQCAVIEKTGRCSEEAVAHEVCEKHLKWRAGHTGQLGFNLIVKNEGSYLATCLQSVRDIADEIVVTDTGSTDNTVAIALEFADKVLFHEWQNDFSEARNFSIQFSRTRWIGWIDGDESLLPKSIQPLLDLIQNDAGFYTIFCALLSELPDGRTSKHYLPKFFRLGTAHFEAIVHNQLVHRSPALPTEVGFWHTGYNLPHERMKAKRQRSMKLLRIQLEENPQDAFATMNLARILMTDGQYQESIALAEGGLKMPDSSGNIRQMLLYNLAMCNTNLGYHDKALNACWDGLSLNPANLDLMFVLGWIHVLKQEWSKAIVYFHRYLDCRSKQETQGFNLLILDFWDAKAMAYNYLGFCYRNLELLEDAIVAQRQAIVFNAYDLMLWKNLALTADAKNDRPLIEQTLFGAIDRGLADADIFSELAHLQVRAA